MGKFIAQQTVKEMVRAGHGVFDSTVTVLGLTFKENCPDLRNSKVIDIIRELQDFGITVQVHDPLADPQDAKHEFGLDLVPWESLKPASAIIVAVAHDDFMKLKPADLKQLAGNNPVLMDVKASYPQREFLQAGIKLWRL
jgi:UDP-N-acetyl-D-galactosamine dehydrogenase